jgi:hypothetical protein
MCMICFLLMLILILFMVAMLMLDFVFICWCLLKSLETYLFLIAAMMLAWLSCFADRYADAESFSDCCANGCLLFNVVFAENLCWRLVIISCWHLLIIGCWADSYSDCYAYSCLFCYVNSCLWRLLVFLVSMLACFPCADVRFLFLVPMMLVLFCYAKFLFMIFVLMLAFYLGINAWLLFLCWCSLVFLC